MNALRAGVIGREGLASIAGLPVRNSRYIVSGRADIRTAEPVTEAGMDRLEGWDQGAPEHRAWTQGPWHGYPADQNSSSRSRGYGDPAWQQAPWDSGGGFGGDEVFAADWTAATVAARDLARRVVRFLLLFVLGG